MPKRSATTVPRPEMAFAPPGLCSDLAPMTRTDPAHRRTVASSSSGLSGPVALTRDLAPPPHPLTLAALCGRSLFPLLTIVWLAGTFLWGPWVTLALAVLTWNLVGRFG